MSDYTPGPWAVEKMDGELWIEAPDGLVACVPPSQVADDEFDILPIDQANALLIAAAPTLLEAAEELIVAIERQLAGTGRGIAPSSRVENAIAETRAAIRLAKGNQP